MLGHLDVRPIDGAGSNPENPTLGAAVGGDGDGATHDQDQILG